MNHKDIAWLTARPIAHRGFHKASDGIIENCTQAFDAAIAHNFAIELDVQVTADGKAAVFHDYSLERLTEGTGRIDEKTLADLAEVPFKQTSDLIMDLKALVDHIDGRVPLVIELKPPKIEDGRLEQAVCAALEGYTGKAALMCFSPQSVARLKSLTDRPRGILSLDYSKSKAEEDLGKADPYALTHMLHVMETEPDFISYNAADLPMPGVDLLKAIYDLPVICWTIKSPESQKNALQHCDQVTFEGYNPDKMT
ncbi:glycerophosphoryl diester phosphodiesterase [Cohaesibacter sp. ES.047]|uniref:glycerophosphodiester phosphodiesterase family protein n=1 Tax=Cohaesibacter sp. ES.047 TaxID=1798205 RepID=UPI000BB72357|nr:glycerophosphodiester phosphodiesterase family protein [Cohaesibacter sp. ES.047]SNY93918.1 glycerophosphoryl diester phosphodiesterase [Cohaesibacter sp. ES.047]